MGMSMDNLEVLHDVEDDSDIILIKRLATFYEDIEWNWGQEESINLAVIEKSVKKGVEEISEPYGDDWKYPVQGNKSVEWHIGRIIYFINHPDEIRNVNIDNEYSGDYIFPIPVIIDGNHRVLAAIYLNSVGKLEKMHCNYGGRLDLLDYLKGVSDTCPSE